MSWSEAPMSSEAGEHKTRTRVCLPVKQSCVPVLTLSSVAYESQPPGVEGTGWTWKSSGEKRTAHLQDLLLQTGASVSMRASRDGLSHHDHDGSGKLERSLNLNMFKLVIQSRKIPKGCVNSATPSLRSSPHRLTRILQRCKRIS